MLIRNYEMQQLLGKLFCEASPLRKSEAMAPWGADSPLPAGRERGDQPSHNQHFCWELLAELMETGTEIAGSNCSKSCRTLKFVLVHQY